MSNYQYIKLPISYLESIDISKESFMQNSEESRHFLKKLFEKVPNYLELKNTFLIKKNFILTLMPKKNIKFNDNCSFQEFSNFIKKTNFFSEIIINEEKKEISINTDISPIFYNLLHEFLI